MIKYDENGKIEAALLNSYGTLSERIINSYDYIKLKNNFNRIVEILSINKTHHGIYNAQLEYGVDENLEFVLLFDNSDTICNNLKKIGRNGVITYSMQYYDESTKACEFLLAQVKNAWDTLNEVEKFIIKSLEFDIPPLTNEALEEELFTYKNKLYIYKKSGYIKLATFLELGHDRLDPEQAKRNLYDYIRWYSEHKIE